MQQVQDKLDFKIETPSNEEVKRRFQDERQQEDKLNRVEGIKVMSDGTKYRTAETGWIKI